MKYLLLTLVTLITTATSSAQYQKAYFQVRGERMQYLIRYPAQYDATRQYPLLVFLHGFGQRGDDNHAQLTYVSDWIDRVAISHEAIILLPQCPYNSFWANMTQGVIGSERYIKFDYAAPQSDAMVMLTGMLDYWLDSGHVDRNRIYVGGLSMGGLGTFELLVRRPNIFAAAFPICGGGDVRPVVKATKRTAIWIFHGSEDKAVPTQFSRDIFAALRKANRNVRYTEYSGVAHNSWENAFAEPELIEWIFNQKLK